MKIGNIDLKWLGHSSFLLDNGKKIYIDPYNISKTDKADIILITHGHHDHCSLDDINKIVKDGTIIIGPVDIQSKLTRIDQKIDVKIVSAGQTLELGDGKKVKIGIVPAYNLNKQFHPKEEGWLGYIVKINNTVLYHAGDTDLIPEMEKLSNISVALLPVGGQYTMDWKEASQAAEIIKPELAIPMHYGGGVIGTEQDADGFVSECQKRGINCQKLEKNDF